jgi:hypothetical protein
VDLKEIGREDWIPLSQRRIQWRAVVNIAILFYNKPGITKKSMEFSAVLVGLYSVELLNSVY